MFIVGIDYSINYASYCIFENFNKFHFGTVINDKSISLKRKSELLYLNEYIENFNILFTNRTDEKVKTTDYDYIKSERLKLLNHIEISSKFINEINKITNYSSDIIVGMEGMSYGSKGSAAFDIPHATGILKRDIVFDLISSDLNKFFIFTPSELKNAIGAKGNCGKEIIFDTFITNPIIESMYDNEFYKYILKNKDDKIVRNIGINGTKIESPFNDMLDAYLSVLKIYNSIKK